nr:HAD-IIIA family hydrolase [Rubellimicrobium aerolatum]
MVIFDADNTLRRVTVPDQPCPHGPGEWEPMPGVRDALAGVRWGPGGLLMGIASNQDHIFYGHLSAEMAQRLLMDAAEAVTGHRPPPGAVRFCAHAMDAGCACRKPAPGLLREAMDFHGVGPAATLFVGDAEVDRKAARRAGVAFLHVADLLARAQSTMPPSRGSESPSVNQKT